MNNGRDETVLKIKMNKVHNHDDAGFSNQTATHPSLRETWETFPWFASQKLLSTRTWEWRDRLTHWGLLVDHSCQWNGKGVWCVVHHEPASHLPERKASQMRTASCVERQRLSHHKPCLQLFKHTCWCLHGGWVGPPCLERCQMDYLAEKKWWREAVRRCQNRPQKGFGRR